MSITPNELDKIKALFERIRVLSEQMNLRGNGSEEFLLLMAAVEMLQAELGKLTGADQDPKWK